MIGKGRIVMSLMLLVAILASIYYEYHFQAKYMLFFITLPLFIALIVVIASGQVEQYIISPMRNLSLWLETPEGQSSGWPLADQLYKKIQCQVVMSPGHPAGRYINYQYQHEDDGSGQEGELDYLSLQCAPKSWNPLRDMDYNNMIASYLSKIEPRSPAQVRNAGKFHGHKQPVSAEEQLKQFKQQNPTLYKNMLGSRARRRTAGADRGAS